MGRNKNKIVIHSSEVVKLNMKFLNYLSGLYIIEFDEDDEKNI